jgi:hypothetical protein
MPINSALRWLYCWLVISWSVCMGFGSITKRFLALRLIIRQTQTLLQMPLSFLDGYHDPPAAAHTARPRSLALHIATDPPPQRRRSPRVCARLFTFCPSAGTACWPLLAPVLRFDRGHPLVVRPCVLSSSSSAYHTSPVARVCEPHLRQGDVRRRPCLRRHCAGRVASAWDTAWRATGLVWSCRARALVGVLGVEGLASLRRRRRSSRSRPPLLGCHHHCVCKRFRGPQQDARTRLPFRRDGPSPPPAPHRRPCAQGTTSACAACQASL